MSEGDASTSDFWPPLPTRDQTKGDNQGMGMSLHRRLISVKRACDKDAPASPAEALDISLVTSLRDDASEKEPPPLGPGLVLHLVRADKTADSSPA